MTQLPNPALPQLVDLAAYGIGGGLIILGAAMLTWGRSLGRGVITVACGLAGYFLATHLPLDIPYFPLPARQLVFVFLLLCFGFLFERLIWGALAALAVAAIAATVMLHVTLVPQSADGTTGTLMTLVQSWYGAATALLTPQQVQAQPLIMAAGVLAFTLLAIGIFCPRIIRILMASVLGALALVAGLAVVISQLLPWFWEQLWARLGQTLEVLAGLAVLGLAWQTYGLVREVRAERKAKAAEEDAKAEAESQTTPGIIPKREIHE